MRIREKNDLIVKLHKGASLDKKGNVKRMVFKNMIIESWDPENIVQLESAKIISMSSISYVFDRFVSFKGYEISKENLFQYLCNSAEIGVYKLGFKSKELKTFHVS